MDFAFLREVRTQSFTAGLEDIEVYILFLPMKPFSMANL